METISLDTALNDIDKNDKKSLKSVFHDDCRFIQGYLYVPNKNHDHSYVKTVLLHYLPTGDIHEIYPGVSDIAVSKKLNWEKHGQKTVICDDKWIEIRRRNKYFTEYSETNKKPNFLLDIKYHYQKMSSYRTHKIDVLKYNSIGEMKKFILNMFQVLTCSENDIDDMKHVIENVFFLYSHKENFFDKISFLHRHRHSDKIEIGLYTSVGFAWYSPKGPAFHALFKNCLNDYEPGRILFDNIIDYCKIAKLGRVEYMHGQHHAYTLEKIQDFRYSTEKLSAHEYISKYRSIMKDNNRDWPFLKLVDYDSV